MDAAGALEVFMPAIQPAELWKESGRWEKYGPELLRIRDRHERDFCFGPTHEEVITDLARREIRSYKQLPVNLYQIQTKFRDEVRPRFGVMRSREFVMKDAYSFDLSHEAHKSSYRRMHDAYCRIFERSGLDYRVVAGRLRRDRRQPLARVPRARGFRRGRDCLQFRQLLRGQCRARPLPGTRRDETGAGHAGG